MSDDLEESADQSPESAPLPRPLRPGDWVIVARTRKVHQDWLQLCNQAAGEAQRVYDKLQTDPTYQDGDRQHPLEGAPGRAQWQGQAVRRWQIDVTSGGRIWYLVDEAPVGAGQRRRSGTVVIDQVHFGHPKSTERRPGGKRRPGRS